ncbi:MAG TPA: Fic family protein [Candidatus Nanoarchaeia archaeon]|nr:Fic family protein [Candidatus Nanoarchaeia archaeon]
MNEITYPSPEQVIAFNHLALALVKVKKADRALLMNRTRLLQIIEECINHPGDPYDKAVVLLAGIVKKHPFASGNRRTAFLVMVDFLWDNNTPCRLQNNPEHARVLLGIREGFYTPHEIKEWIQHGKIRPFKR